MTRVQAWEGVGLAIPERRSDCSGQRPSWFPFQRNVCDVDAPDYDPLPTARHMQIPADPGDVPDWPKEPAIP